MVPQARGAEQKLTRAGATKRHEELFFLKTAQCIILAAATLFAEEPPGGPREIAQHRTVHGAQASVRPNPIPVRYVYGAARDWRRQPYQLAVILVECSDRKHEGAHTAAFYNKLLFSRGEYLKTPAGEASFGSVADWYRAQSQGHFLLAGKVFDWVTVDETFETIHGLKIKEAQARYLKVALAKIRARDGTTVLDGFDGYLFIHAGPITGPPGNIFWSHRANVEDRRYITTGEIERIGVFCHEFGHMLGLPDFYGKKGVRESFGPWCAMASGYRGTYPKSFCVWSKTRLGWCRPTVVDAATPQRLVLRPIQTNPHDAFLIPLNTSDDVGTEFLLLENRAATGNDAEGQPGLFIWRISRKPDSQSFPVFDLKLPGPADQPHTDASTRRVAWPAGNARDFVIPPEAGTFPVAIRNIQLNGGLVFFELGPK
ncbi:MAG: M6 family metalloprotease domain-containing protein [Verrucomicrobia bacterium]|nr:M6 family metalloprotease domain-containing protein [Verrucomicrobiota bacterium]